MPGEGQGMQYTTEMEKIYEDELPHKKTYF